MRRRPVIAISGPPGAGSTTLANEVAKQLGLKTFSPGFIQKGLVAGKNQSEASIKAWQTRRCKSKTFHKHLDKEQIELAKRGGIVICGKLSVHFLKDIADLTVWLDVPLSVRARRTAKRDGISYAKAYESIKRRQEIERAEWQRMYGFDYFKQKYEADLVLDTSGMTARQAAKKIIDRLND
ncbi:MAG: cytidylate kinase family protein [Candidatus Aenigmatarchaeota archaeon]